MSKNISDAVTKRMRVGDRVRLMGRESTVIDIHERGGVECELYKSAERDEHGFFTGAIRIIDVESMMVVGITSFPSWRFAQAKYRRDKL